MAVKDFGTVVREIYDQQIIYIKGEFPDINSESLKQMAREWTEDEVAFRAREIMDIWEDCE